MKNKTNSKQYIYHTRGVCPPEIHFKINEGKLNELRFVGGGCPGNAQLVARLLDGKTLEDALHCLSGIDCRNGTSCPDQLVSAIQAVQNSSLDPAESFRAYHDISPKRRIGLIGAIEGNRPVLEQLLERIQKTNIESVYCCGNLTGNSLQNSEVIQIIRKENILAFQGKNDWLYAHGKEEADMPSLEQKDKDWLLRLPQVLSFQLQGKKGVAFFGDFIQTFPDFSDFEPFALEMNMVCGLTDFMQDETVFPALEAMTPQFQTDIIVFSQTQKWNHWHIAGKDFISVGPACQNNRLSWGVIEILKDKIDLKILET